MGPDARTRRNERMKNNLLRIPHGTETLYLEETYRHKKILRHMEDLTESWGYLPVQTPVFDYYDNYRPLLDHKLEEQTYKLIDRDGDLMMLRSDITLFLARQMGLSLSEVEMPVRVYYADSILRYQDHEDINNHEFFQTGCELIGCPGKEGDLEILFLLAQILKEFKLPLSRIHIGSMGVFNAVSAPLSKEDSKELSNLLQTREEEGILNILKTVYKAEDARKLAGLLLFIGTGKEFQAAMSGWSSLLDGLLADPLSYLDSIYRGWEELGVFEDILRIDLSETGDQTYYSGIVFNAYTDGCGTAMASGGRYDGLLENFGYSGETPASSVGFSLFLRKMEKLSGFEPEDSGTSLLKEKCQLTAVERYQKATAGKKA